MEDVFISAQHPRCAAYLRHLHTHLSHGLADLWQFDEGVGKLHDLGGLLQRPRDLRHSFTADPPVQYKGHRMGGPPTHPVVAVAGFQWSLA